MRFIQSIVFIIVWDAVVTVGDDVAVPVGSYANEDITADRPLFSAAISWNNTVIIMSESNEE